jgi:plastocyanin
MIRFARFLNAANPARIFVILAALFAFAPCVFADAMIEGTVTIPARTAPPQATQRYGATGEIPSPEPPAAIIYLEGKFPDAASAPRVKLPQKNFRFATGLLPIRKGTAVEFPNEDDFYHNVFSYSKTKRFDLGRYLKTEQPPAQVFDQPGVVRLYCEIHEHMRCTLVVLDTPHFAKSKPDGAFRLEKLPPGNYVLKAWLGEKDVRERPVQLRDGQTARVDFPAR